MCLHLLLFTGIWANNFVDTATCYALILETTSLTSCSASTAQKSEVTRKKL